MTLQLASFIFYAKTGVKYACTPLVVSWGYSSFSFALFQLEQGVDGYWGTARSLFSFAFKRYDSPAYLVDSIVWIQFAFIAFKGIEFNKRKRPEPIDSDQLPF